MNKKNLILTSTVGMTRQQWLEFRQPLIHAKKLIRSIVEKQTGTPIEVEQFFNGQMDRQAIYDWLKAIFQEREEWKTAELPTLGASEVSTIMGLNPYKSIIELYFEKIGVKPMFDGDNASMFWGRELEEQIAQKWQYWDGNVEGMISNFTAGTIIRKCRRVNFYIQNKAFPWLFVSLDRIINKQFTDKEAVNEGSLECKTISGYAADMWEGGIPPMYVAQLQTQIAVLEFDFGEMAILKDGRNFDVLPFDKHDLIASRIIEQSKAFSSTVKFGIEQFLLHTYATTQELKDFHYSELERVSPEPDGSVAYEKYLSDNYKDRNIGGIEGTAKELELARRAVFCNEKIKDFTEMKRGATNRLKDAIGDHNKIDFGPDGSVTWKEASNGVRSMRLQVKLPVGYEPGKIDVDPGQEIEKLVQEEKQPDPIQQAPFENDPATKRKKKTVAEDSNRGE